MTGGQTLDETLAASMAHALLPPRFPVRRDLEIESAVRADAGMISCYDYFWRGAHVILVSAIRLNRSGLDGAFAASGIRALLRALADCVDKPSDILADLRRRSAGAEFDAALLELDTRSGAVRTATHGQANVRRAGRPGDFEADAMRENDILWVTAGALSPLPAAGMEEDGLVSLVRPAMHASGAGAGTAVVFKSPARTPRDTTFSMTNDIEAIPPLLNAINRHLHHQGVGEEAAHGLDVALDELLTNIVNYGYQDGNVHEILVDITVGTDVLIMELRDDGKPFDPLGVPEPDLSVDLEDRHVGGLGMHFVRSLLDSVVYKRSNGWNVLTLEKRLPQGTGAQGLS
jgi:anti-sigma regulatory factor (Ser/Thr protein kinase)